MRDYTGSQGAVYWSMGGGVLWWSPVSHEGLYRLSVCRLMVYEWSYRVLGWSQVSHQGIYRLSGYCFMVYTYLILD